MHQASRPSGHLDKPQLLLNIFVRRSYHYTASGCSSPAFEYEVCDLIDRILQVLQLSGRFEVYCMYCVQVCEFREARWQKREMLFPKYPRLQWADALISDERSRPLRQRPPVGGRSVMRATPPDTAALQPSVNLSPFSSTDAGCESPQ